MKHVFAKLLLGVFILAFLHAEEHQCQKQQKLVITGIIPGGAAEKISLQPNDVLVKYNGQAVHCLNQLGMLKSEVTADSVELSILRDEAVLVYKIPKGDIGVYLEEVLPDLSYEDDAVVLNGIGDLGWGKGEDNSFIAALTRIAEYLGIKKDYNYLMGSSGAAFRILFHETWCPSSPDATVGYDCGSLAMQSIHLKPEWIRYVEMADNKDEMLDKIKKSLENKIPIIAIDLIETAEWGLIVGYQKQGKELIVRTYFDKRQGYDIAGKFPWIIVLVKQETGKIDDKKNFKRSLKIAQELYETEKYEAYYSGIAALEYWIKMLKEEKFGELDSTKFSQVMLANAWIFERLASDRVAAVRYLNSFIDQFPKVKEKIEKLVSIYENESKLLLESGSAILYPMQMKARGDWTSAMKDKEIEVLTRVLENEKQALQVIKEINSKL